MIIIISDYSVIIVMIISYYSVFSFRVSCGFLE